MKAALTRLFGGIPIPIRHGPLRGLRWSAFPWSAYWRGTFEPELTRTIASHLPGSGGACWDIGAHFGYYSVQMARSVGPSGEVLAVEANPASFHYLQKHQRWNRLTQLRCVCLAASDQPGHVALLNYFDATSTTAHLAFPNENTAVVPSQQSVPAARLDDVARELGLRLPDLVKIDVEGHGGSVVRGMEMTLRAKQPVIFAAFHDRAEADGFRAVLTPLGYQASLNGRPPPEPWPEIGDYLFLPR